MADKPDDRPKKTGAGTDPTPKIYVIVDGQKFPRPGLETFLAEAGTGARDQKGEKEAHRVACSCQPVAGIWCECNKVRVCACEGHTVCACVGHTVKKRSCGCVGHRSGCRCAGHRSHGGGCRCAPVH